MTTNLPFDEWTEVFGSERLTGALLDRLTHHVHILEMNGESYRLKRSREGAASKLETSLTKNRLHQDLPACHLLLHPSSGHFPQQVALIFMLAS